MRFRFAAGRATLCYSRFGLPVTFLVWSDVRETFGGFSLFVMSICVVLSPGICTSAFVASKRVIS